MFLPLGRMAVHDAFAETVAARAAASSPQLRLKILIACGPAYAAAFAACQACWNSGLAKLAAACLLCAQNATTAPRSEDRGSEGVTFAELMKLLKPHITAEEGTSVTIKPTVIVEVAYEEIQKSPKYASGFALRFPRVAKIRWDRGPADADTLERISKLYATQRGRKK